MYQIDLWEQRTSGIWCFGDVSDRPLGTENFGNMVLRQQSSKDTNLGNIELHEHSFGNRDFGITELRKHRAFAIQSSGNIELLQPRALETELLQPTARETDFGNAEFRKQSFCNSEFRKDRALATQSSGNVELLQRRVSETQSFATQSSGNIELGGEHRARTGTVAPET